MNEVTELRAKLVVVQTGLLKTMKSYALETQRLNAALRCLVKIKRAYPHIFNECLSEEDILNIEKGGEDHERKNIEGTDG